MPLYPQNNFALRILTLLTVPLLATCARPSASTPATLPATKPPIAHITISSIALSAQSNDTFIAIPLATHLSLPRTQNVTTIASATRVDIYITADPATVPTTLLAAINAALVSISSRLPRNAIMTPASLLAPDEKIPTVTVTLVAVPELTIDREAAAKLGITQNQIDDLLLRLQFPEAPLPNPGTAKKILDTPIFIANQPVPLSAIASLSIRSESDHMQHSYPNAKQNP